MDIKKTLIEHNKNIKNTIYSIIKTNNEDLEQEVAIKIWNNKDRYKNIGSLKAWVSTITKNIVKDYLKSSKYKTTINSTSEELIVNNIVDIKQTPDLSLERKIRKKRITNAINNLKPKFKEIIIMYEFENQTYEQISSKLNIPIGTVKSRLYNAKQILSEELSDLM